MDIRILQYFLAVARERNITKAAEKLHMTQPPLSRQIRELEEEIGAQLFIRGGRQLVLTDAGTLLHKRAAQLVDLFEKTREEMTALDESVIGGQVRIAGGESEAVALIAETVRRLRRRYPDIHYLMASGDERLVREMLDNGEVDFGLFIGTVDLARYDALTWPCKDRWGVLMRSDSELAAHDEIIPEDLRDKPLILSRQELAGGSLRAWLGAARRDLDPVLTYELIYNATHFVRNGLGYAITLAGLVNTEGDAALCFRDLAPRLEAPLYFVWRRDQVFSRAAQVFLEQLRKDLLGEDVQRR